MRNDSGVLVYACADCGAEDNYREMAEISFYVGYRKHTFTICRACLTERLWFLVEPLVDNVKEK